MFKKIDFNVMPPQDLIIYNELRSCRYIRNQEFENVFKPKYNYGFLKWDNNKQTRFADSLFKGVPISSISIALDYKTREQIIIDGLERINTIHKLLSEEKWELSKLDDIDPSISGKTNLEIQNEHPEFIENFPLPVYVIICDFQKQEHIDFISLIYQRLR